MEPKHLTKPKARKAGRPTKAALARNPPVPVEPTDIPQPPQRGIRNPPCCRTAMVPRERKAIGDGTYRVRCGHCNARLIVTYVNGTPTSARKA